MLRTIISNEWFTVLILLSVGILAFTRYSYNSRFIDFLGLLGNSKYLKIYSRDQKFIDQFDSLLFTNLLISGTIFIYVCYGVLYSPVDFEWALFLKILLLFGTVLLIKVLIERLIGSVFEIDSLIHEYVFQKTNYKNYIGLVLLPLNVLLIYALPLSKTLIYAILGLIILINLSGFFTSIKANQKLILANFFYFILYLCALEIGPYIILYQVITD
ncbi:MAG: DUF4271 domain-containing protein [Flavobacteriaceae bacterium]|nr:DUF4271 domain-containing protein [Flavobacteriaceae bacterium]